jgi:hypothetical protein
VPEGFRSPSCLTLACGLIILGDAEWDEIKSNDKESTGVIHWHFEHDSDIPLRAPCNETKSPLSGPTKGTDFEVAAKALNILMGAVNR